MHCVSFHCISFCFLESEYKYDTFHPTLLLSLVIGLDLTSW